MRSDIGGVDGIDEIDRATSVLPPPPEQLLDPGEQLWHTASFAAITDEPPPRRKLTTALIGLGILTVAVCGYAGVKLAVLAGLAPPSPVNPFRVVGGGEHRPGTRVTPASR